MQSANPSSDAALTVTLAEYSALRAEIVAHSNSQATLLGVALTAIGVVVGIVLSGKAGREVLLVIPILAPALGLAFVGQMRHLSLLGLYIRGALWPVLQAQVSDVTLPSWEAVWAAYNTPSSHRRKRTYMAFRLVAGLPPGAVFFLSSVVALAYTTGPAFERIEYGVVWVLGCCLSALFVLTALYFSSAFRTSDLETVIDPSTELDELNAT